MLAALLLGGAPGNAAGLSIPVLGADSAYSLQEAAPDDTNKITVYQTEEVIKYYDKLTVQEIQEGQLQPDIEYNQVSSIALAPQDYSLTLNKTVYGDVENHNEADNMYYKFSVDDAGNVNMNLSDSSDYDILYHVSNVINKSDRLTANDANDQLYDTFDISENFISLVTEGKPYDPYYDDGGAIYNNMGVDIGVITGDFVDNHAYSDRYSYGGAIYQPTGSIKAIKGDFIGNSNFSEYNTASGGAIHLDSATIGTIEGDFIGNFSSGDASEGGAISIYRGGIDSIKGNFIANHAGDAGNATGTNPEGGAIYNSGTIKDLNGDFIYNYTTQDSAYQPSGGGGAIYNTGNMDSIKGDFIGNHSVGGVSIGGAIYNEDGVIGNLTGNFIGNYTSSQKITTQGGAIYNDGDLVITNSNFFNNHADCLTGSAQGGAVYAKNDLTVNAEDGFTSIFSGNYVEDKNGKRDEAIYAASGAVLGLNTTTGGQIYMNDKINGAKGYTLSLKGDDTGKITFNNSVQNANIMTNTGSNVYLTRENLWDNNSFQANGGTLSFVNNSIGISQLSDMTVTQDTNFIADVNLETKEMDRFTAGSYGEHTGNLNVIGMNLLNDAPEGQDVTAVYFAEPGLKNNVSNGMGELPNSFQTTAYTPIYKYNVTYDNENEYDGKGDGGYFLFTRGDRIPSITDPDEPDIPIIPGGGGGSTGNPSDAFNPAVLATPVNNLAAGQAAVNEAFKYVFEHADAFTQMPEMERYAKINANKYAINTQFNDFLPSFGSQFKNDSVWFRPYTSFERMNIKNGPKVDAITYGSLVGFDGDFKEMKNGWNRIFTGYAGYMGASLHYANVDTVMNGGLLGFTETFYKGNFWTAVTASAGASVGASHTMYGKEDFTSLLAGVGSNTGYNFEFKEGKYIIQPIMYLSYTFVNTFDYKNAAGVNIESDPLHTIQLNPSVRFIANMKNGWQPYASVGMVWNLMNESKITANNVKLPEMSVKPYVEYGVGVQRNWADKFTAFLQAMIRNGGRNGIALTGGFRFMLGSDDKDNDKPKVKKEIKSL